MGKLLHCKRVNRVLSLSQPGARGSCAGVYSSKREGRARWGHQMVAMIVGDEGVLQGAGTHTHHLRAGTEVLWLRGAEV